MTALPRTVVATIRHALVFNVLDYHQRYGDRIRRASLYPDVVDSVKWLHGQDPQAAADLVAEALTEITAERGGPALDLAARCVRHSLTFLTDHGEWTEDQADRFVTAATESTG
ncbi:hypothetical protein OOK44_38230 [Streptomyces cellulosae]|uniref:hypothetical protein n=1 Tax=Streptomyces cellulosae TaxID=1968 RepID=UPI00225660E8|nr:hypothetical protein [Streptomyces cellulosae]MCX4482216.1 hypothetical protein [Streptomyces cellulosae]